MTKCKGKMGDCCAVFSSLIGCIPFCTIPDHSDNVSLSQVFYFKHVKVLQLSSATCFGQHFKVSVLECSREVCFKHEVCCMAAAKYVPIVCFAVCICI